MEHSILNKSAVLGNQEGSMFHYNIFQHLKVAQTKMHIFTLTVKVRDFRRDMC